MEKDELKKYYEKYLKENRELLVATVRHYSDALNTISRLLKKENKIVDSIYDIESVDELEELISYISNNEEYKGLNKRGNNMYSAGVKHFFKFVSGEKFKEDLFDISILDIPVERKNKKVGVKESVDRSNIIRNHVIECSDHKCEYDNSHISFIQEKKQATVC